MVSPACSAWRFPAMLRAAKADPRIAAGPVVLAAADVVTLLLYFGLGARLLGVDKQGSAARNSAARTRAAMCPGAQRAQLEPAELHAPQPRHRVPDRIEQPPDFAVLAFGQRDRQVALALRSFRTDAAAAVSRSPPTVMPVRSVRAAVSSVDVALDRDQIDARDLRRWIGQPVCELRVVGQDQQPAGGEVEAADRDHAVGQIGEQVVDGLAAFGIGSRGDVAARLVQDDGERFGAAALRRAVDRDRDALGDDARRRVGEGLAVDADAPLEDQRARLGAAGEAELRQRALERDDVSRRPVCAP